MNTDTRRSGEALADAANALLEINRYAKQDAGSRDVIYELKNEFLSWLFRHGLCIGWNLHTLVKPEKKLECYGCDGTGHARSYRYGGWSHRYDNIEDEFDDDFDDDNYDEDYGDEDYGDEDDLYFDAAPGAIGSSATPATEVSTAAGTTNNASAESGGDTHDHPEGEVDDDKQEDEDEDEPDCYRCGGTGIYRTLPELRLEFVVFRFEVGGRRYTWHQPREIVSWDFSSAPKYDDAGDWDANDEPTPSSYETIAEVKTAMGVIRRVMSGGEVGGEEAAE